MKLKYRLVLICLLVSAPLCAQSPAHINKEHLVAFIDSMFIDGVNQKLIPGGVAALVSNEGSIMTKGYGLSDVASNIPVSVDSTLFQIGSVGKIFTAIAVLQNEEAGRIDLNTDVEHYFNELKINHSNEESITPFHLLTHTAGLNEQHIGYVERSISQVESLETYFTNNQPTAFQVPGKNINYSNVGYGLAGYLVETVTGKNFSEYIENHILLPAKMSKTTYYLPDDYRSRDEYAKGYEVRKNYNEVISYPRSLLPAGSILSTGDDMSRFLEALLKKDRFLNNDSYNKLYSQQFTNHKMLPGVTFGFEEQFVNGRRFLAKGGSVPGFLSFILIIPEEHIGLFVAVNTETDNFSRNFLTQFYDRFFPSQEDEEIAARDIAYSGLSGTYRNLRAGHNTISELFEMMIDHKKVQKLDEATLGVVINDRYVKFKASGDTIFTRSGNKDQKLIFARENGNFQYLYGSETIAGLQVPASYKKVAFIFTPDTINEFYPFLLLPIPLYIIVFIILSATWYLKKKRNRLDQKSTLPIIAHIISLAFSVLFVLDITGFFIPLIELVRNGELLFGLPEHLKMFRYLHWLMLIIGLAIAGITAFLWIARKGSIISRLLYTIYFLSAGFYLFILNKWNFLSISV